MERVPSLQILKDKFVHFDIDPQTGELYTLSFGTQVSCKSGSLISPAPKTVLVGQSDPASSHPVVPPLILCDFGSALKLTADDFREPYATSFNVLVWYSKIGLLIVATA
jgi:hypothetical protein